MNTETISDDGTAHAMKRYDQALIRRLERLRETKLLQQQIAAAEELDLRKALNAQLRMIIGVMGAYSALLCGVAYLMARYFN